MFFKNKPTFFSGNDSNIPSIKCDFSQNLKNCKEQLTIKIRYVWRKMIFLTKIQDASPYFGFILDSLYARFVRDVSIAYNEFRLYVLSLFSTKFSLILYHQMQVGSHFSFLLTCNIFEDHNWSTERTLGTLIYGMKRDEWVMLHIIWI